MILALGLILSCMTSATFSGSSVDYKCQMAQAYAQAGMIEEAQRLLGELLGNETIPVPLHEISLLYKALGQEEQAFSFLARALDEQSFIVNTTNKDPRWDVFREDPAYEELLEKIDAED